MNRRFKAVLLAVFVLALLALAACGGGNDGNGNGADDDNGNGNGDAADGVTYTPGGEDAAPEGHPDFDDTVEGEIYIMIAWGNQFNRDIGNMVVDPEENGCMFFAAFHSTARVFNEIFPNVVINLYQTENSYYWDQQRRNFEAEHGRFPDIFQSHNLAWDATAGLVADLSVYADDPRMQSINPAILDMFTVHGFIPGLPRETIPQGVFVNRELAEQHNINPPRIDWTIQEFTDFINHTDGRTYWGMWEPPIDFISHGTPYIHYALARSEGVATVDLNNPAVRNLLSYVPLWTRDSMQSLNRQHQIPAGLLDSLWWWRIMFFARSHILVTHTNHWELGRMANAVDEIQMANSLRVVSNDWDVFPFPSTPYMGNTIQIHSGAWAIYNYAEGAHEWTAEQEAQRDLAFSFMMFYLTDNRAWEARSQEQMIIGINVPAGYVDVIGTQVPTSFPIVTGADFDFQMQTMFNTDSFSMLADRSRFPGFHRVMEIFQSGEAVGIFGTAIPMYVDEAGTVVNAMVYWHNIHQHWIVDAYTHEPQWLDAILAHLPEWNRVTNDRLARADQQFREALEHWYGIVVN